MCIWTRKSPSLSVRRDREKKIKQFGRCDVLCVNAGIIESNSTEHINIDKMCEMVRLKVEMSFRQIYTFLKYFKEQGKGHISHSLQSKDIAQIVWDILNMPVHIRVPRYMVLPKGHQI